MPSYDYLCSKCKKTTEIFHSMSCEDGFFCEKCNNKLEKQISSTFYVSVKAGLTIENQKATEHLKKVKDPDRAVRMRKKIFGKEAVGDPSMQSDQRHKVTPNHIIKKGRTLGGQQMEVDKKEITKALSKDPVAVKIAQDIVKKQRS